jgi:hypothetical protein
MILHWINPRENKGNETMKEAYIHLPVMSNEGHDFPLAMREAFEDRLLEAFGGYSNSIVHGAWKDPKTGIVYREPMQRYVIAHDWDGFAAGKLRRLARLAATTFEQECIYINLPSTGVEFIEPIETVEAA